MACDRFIYIEILKNKSKQASASKDSKEKSTKNDVDKITPKVIELIASTIADVTDEDGWAFLGDVGSLLQKKQPNFDSRNYGFHKLTPMINSIDQFEIESRDNQKGRLKLIYVRNKE